MNFPRSDAARDFSAKKGKTLHPASEAGNVHQPSRKRSGAQRDWKFWAPLLGVAALVAIVTAVFSFTDLQWSDVHAALQRLPASWAIALMAVLPLVGFSVSIVHLVAGVRFGLLLGGVVVTAVTIVHLLASYWIARSFLRAPLERFLARKKHPLPKVSPDAHVSVAIMACLVPGIPYFARNYLLALSGVPLRTYFWVCLPIHVARSYMTIFLGDLTSEPNLYRWLILAAMFVVNLTVCAIIVARLRHRHWREDPTANATVGSSECH